MMSTQTYIAYLNSMEAAAGCVFIPRGAASWPAPLPVSGPCNVLSRHELDCILEFEEEAFFRSRAEISTEAYHSTVADDVTYDAEPSEVDGGSTQGPKLCWSEARDDEEVHFCRPAQVGSKDGVVNGSEATTLMVRNIACRTTAEQLLEHLRALGFDGLYDFFYLPVFRGRGASNCGYFFLNFKSPEAAFAFKTEVQGKPMGSGTKLCDVTPAEWQGLPALRAQFRKKAVLKSSNAPLFL